MAVPNPWSEMEGLSREKFIHLSTKGRVSGKSHTVELWFACGNGKVYLSHEGELTDWMKNVGKHPRVRFEVAGSEFSGEARVTDGGPEFEEGKFTLYEKYYGKAPREKVDDWFSLSKIVVIRPVSGG